MESSPAPPAEAGRSRAALLGAAGAMVGIAGGIARSKVVAIELGPTGVGQVAETLQFATLALTPASVALGPGLLSQLTLSRTPADSARRAGTLAVAIAAIGMAVTLIVGPLALSPEIPLYVLAIALVWQFAQTLAQLPTQVLTSRQELGKLSGFNTIQALCITAGLIVGVLVSGFTGQFVGAAIGASMATGIGFIWGGRALADNIIPRGLPSRDFAKSLVQIGATGLVGGLAMQLALIGIRDGALDTGGAALLGQFQASWSISTTYFSVVLTGLMSFAFPRFAAARDSDELGREIRTNLRFFLATVPSLLIVAIAFRRAGIHILYDDRFDLAAELLGYQLAGDIMKGASWLLAAPLLVRGQLRAFLITEIVGAFALVGCTRLLIPWLGPLALGAGYLLAYILYSFVVLLVLRRYKIHNLSIYIGVSVSLVVLALLVNALTSRWPGAAWVVGPAAFLALLLGPGYSHFSGKLARGWQRLRGAR